MEKAPDPRDTRIVIDRQRQLEEYRWEVANARRELVRLRVLNAQQTRLIVDQAAEIERLKG